jgi:hypothetical protein
MRRRKTRHPEADSDRFVIVCDYEFDAALDRALPSPRSSRNFSRRHSGHKQVVAEGDAATGG